MKRFIVLLMITPLVATALLQAQIEQRDRAVFVTPTNEFLDSLKAEAARFAAPKEAPAKVLRIDFSRVDAPKSVNDFTSAWRFPPISQGLSGMCWCFSTTSFFESEIYRLTKREIKLSELYTVYWEYVEKVKEFVRTRGTSVFGQGSEANAVPRIWRMYGIVPESAYTGLLPGQKVHDHDRLFAEMNTYLQSVKAAQAWDEETVIRTIRSILDHDIGEPPAKVTVGGKAMTPKEYLRDVVRLNPDDYVDVLSLMQQPFYQRVEYPVPDNWWHSKDYYNVPLDDFMAIVKNAIRNGYTIAIGGDVSEPGLEGHAGIAIVPTFDIPPALIDDAARQFRFSNGSTGDDHGIHLVGYTQKDGVDWYLIKDSGSGSRNNTHPGYYFYREDYVKLKMVDFMVHKDMAKSILAKFK